MSVSQPRYCAGYIHLTILLRYDNMYIWKYAMHQCYTTAGQASLYLPVHTTSFGLLTRWHKKTTVIWCALFAWNNCFSSSRWLAKAVSSYFYFVSRICPFAIRKLFPAKTCDTPLDHQLLMCLSVSRCYHNNDVDYQVKPTTTIDLCTYTNMIAYEANVLQYILCLGDKNRVNLW